MANVSLVLRFCIVAALAVALDMMSPASGQAAKKTKFVNGPISVRLCPIRCQEVKRHSYRTGGTATVYETRGTWARVSEHIDPAKLSKFRNVPEKPAFWVRTRQLADPNISVAGTAAPASSATEQQPAPEGTPAKKPKKAAKKPQKRFLQRRKVTLPSFRPGTDTQLASLDTNPAAAPSEIKPVIPDTAPDTGSETPKVEVPAAEMKKEELPKPVAKDEVVYNAPKAPEAPENTDAAVKDDTKAEPEKKSGIQTLTDADKFVAPEEPKVEPVPEKVAEHPKPEVSVEKPAEVAKNEPAPEKPEEAPKAETPSQETKVAALETNDESNAIVPLTTEERPKTFTKALRDKRLSKLPGAKSKRFKREEVIALRHHALMLLKNKECGGIVGGGRSVGQSGILYVVCKEDPSYLRQFPLEELSW